MASTLLMLVTAVAVPRITTTPVGEARWRLTISAVGKSIETAEARLTAHARQLCRGKTPTFGKYRFTGTAPLTGPARDHPQTLTLTQDISCAASLPAPALATAVRAPAVDPAAAGLAYAKRYLVARDTGDRATLKATVDAEAMNLPEILRGLSAERGKLGAPVGVARYKVTVYRNPPDSPGPGTYVAVDYVRAYRNAPWVCGYVIVLEPPGRAMTITREERAIIDATSAATLPPAELVAIRERFRCNIP